MLIFSCKMIYLLVGSHIIIKGKRPAFLHSNSRNTYVSLKFPTNYIVETSGGVLQNRFKLCYQVNILMYCKHF